MGGPAVRAFFDTNIVIDLLAAYPAAMTEAGLYHQVAISRITWMEVLIGAPDPVIQQQWETFLDQFQLVELTEQVCRDAILIRQHSRMKLPDALILAGSRHYGTDLVTRNTRDFAPGTAGVRIPYQR